MEELKAADARDGGGATHKELFDLKSFFVDYLGDLAQGVKLRQRAIATAAVYFRRFYLRQSLREYDPRKLAPACLYLAAKVEECAVQAHDIAAQTRKVCEGERYRQEASPSWHLTVPELLDLELFLVQALEFCLVIFHPRITAWRFFFFFFRKQTEGGGPWAAPPSARQATSLRVHCSEYQNLVPVALIRGPDLAHR